MQAAAELVRLDRGVDRKFVEKRRHDCREQWRMSLAICANDALGRCRRKRLCTSRALVPGPRQVSSATSTGQWVSGGPDDTAEHTAPRHQCVLRSSDRPAEQLPGRHQYPPRRHVPIIVIADRVSACQFCVIAPESVVPFRCNSPTPPVSTLAMTVTDDNSMLCGTDVRRRFDHAADHFDDVDFIHRVTRDGLFARIQPMSVEAGVVVDLGSATGSAGRPLEKRFRGARVVAVDLSRKMLGKLRRKRAWLSKIAAVQSDARALPFADASVDVVFSNMLLPWIDDPAAAFSEIARVLRQDGLFAFATLGPDSLLELRDAWKAVDTGVHVKQFADMHDIGDALVRAGLRDPVLDVDHLSVNYSNSAALFRDITATGARNSLRQRARGLLGRQRLATMTDALFNAEGNGGTTLSFELVYGHCWGGAARNAADAIPIDAANIPVRRR